jgi:hypothetical protein
MGKTRQVLVNTFATIVVFYLVSCSFAALYFNWKYARDNGFVKWILLGEFVPTAKSLVWPYFALAPGPPSSSNTAISASGVEPAAGLNDSEMSQLFAELRIAMETNLTPDGSNRIREILKGYVTRKGNYLSKSWFKEKFEGLRNLVEYKYELGRSVVLSWDSSQYSVTPEFTALRRTVSDLVPGPQLSEDTQMLEAAARHDTVITDSEGHKYYFDRDHLVSGMNHRDKQRLGLGQVLEIVNEFVR